ncbi:MAG TPA: alkaline phosphatase [Verrucomicrobiales bacterium]|nr:alkaline phosphatase [Verrucomicrobiales bacterium]HRK12725.1 alkaline phosphatase D family protein [Prosthecobacter sp.]
MPPRIPTAIVFSLACLAAGHAEVHTAQGILSGEATATSVLLQTRLTAIPGPELDREGDVPGAEGVACFEYGADPAFANAARTPWLRAAPDRDFIVRAHVMGLKAGTLYHCRVIAGKDEADARPGRAGSFRTLPDAAGHAPLSFVMGSCMNYHSFMAGKANGGGPVTATEEDKRLGYPSFAAMSALRPAFFIGTGDIVYYDHPAQAAASTLPELRRKWHEQFRFPRMTDFFAVTPAYWSKDDHDFRYNDADLRGEREPRAGTGIEIFREQMPVLPADAAATPTYRTHRVHRHAQLWFVEGRDYRSPNKMPDGPDKTLWGAEQRVWLQRTLKESDAPWKIIITPTPMVGPDRNSKTDNHTNLAGFKHEADSFFEWLRAEGVTGVLTFCGDRHWQYHSIHPLGVEEFSVGALNDENAIRGERPGGPKTTDPEGKIKQPYIYSEPTGGFLHVTLSTGTQGRAKLGIEFRDDHGKVLHSVLKRAE